MAYGNIFSNMKSFILGLNTGHLWYLLMLFNTFILFYLYEKFILNKKYSIILNLILFQFVEKPPVKKAEGFCLLVVDKV